MWGTLLVATARREGFVGCGESHIAWNETQEFECGARFRVLCGGRRGRTWW